MALYTGICLQMYKYYTCISVDALLSDDSMACILVKSPLNAIFEDQVRNFCENEISDCFQILYSRIFCFVLAGHKFGGLTQQGIPLILAEIILVNPILLIKTLLSIYSLEVNVL